MAHRCFNCFRPQEYCLCKYVTPSIDAGIKFIFLMHPKEAKRQRTGTGRISSIGLKDSEILIGISFEHNQRLLSLLANPEYYPVLLYPGEEAWTVKREGFRETVGTKKLLVIILDATWFCAKKLIDNNPSLLKLPRLSFSGDYRSIFTFKKEPKPEYISTIESCYYLIKELQTINLIADSVDPDPLMTAFKNLISDQIQAENDRIAGIKPSNHAYDWKYTKQRENPF